MRLVIISDTHNRLDKVKVPEGDILIHAGDATFQGTVPEISRFNYELGKLPFSRRLFCAGNHDWLFQMNPTLAREIMTNAEVLIDEEVIIDGVKFYFSPWQPFFGDWAFNLHRGKPLADKWALIPDDTQVLVTHGPPYGFGDELDSRERIGCVDLLNRVKQLKYLSTHIFGHAHSGYGIYKDGNITFINAAICDEGYDPNNAPIVIDI